MNFRCRSAFVSGIPVVSRSSPPESHGVGSSSSVMCTQRISRSAAVLPPAATLRPSSEVRLSTVSISVLGRSPRRTRASPGAFGSHASSSLFEGGPKDVDDLLELLRIGDQRRGGLEHPDAAGGGAADQPPPGERPRGGAAPGGPRPPPV